MHYAQAATYTCENNSQHQHHIKFPFNYLYNFTCGINRRIKPGRIHLHPSGSTLQICGGGSTCDDATCGLSADATSTWACDGGCVLVVEKFMGCPVGYVG